MQLKENKNHLILSSLFLIIFFDYFSLGLIYPIFTSLVFLGNGGIIPLEASEFYKNATYSLLITLFPFAKFFGAPVLGKLSDQYGCRKLLIMSLVGTVVALMICTVGIFYSSLSALFFGRLVGGLIGGKTALIYAFIAKLSNSQQKVRNFALIQLASGIGFSSGPYISSLVSKSAYPLLVGPLFPFILAIVSGSIGLFLLFLILPKDSLELNITPSADSLFSNLLHLWKAFNLASLRPYLLILFLMVSSNLVFIQFIGPFALESYNVNVETINYIYSYIGIAFAIGHLCFTRPLANYFSPERALLGSLTCMIIFLILLLMSTGSQALYVLTFLIMIACAVANTNAISLVSNQRSTEKQGEIMGIAVSIICCAEFLPALILGFGKSFSLSIPILGSTLSAFGSFLVLIRLLKKERAKAKA
jgi:MFS transporter, DHA1 family, tetracycline resistance protein